MIDDSFLKFAAIDIGSNAIRLLLAGVLENGSKTTFHKVSLMRMPVRLGQEAFTEKRFSPEKKEALVSSLSGFRRLMDAYGPISMMACATAAMREAENGGEICDVIAAETGIRIEIIDGKKEAEILLNNNKNVNLPDTGRLLYVDVGGGSTEITILKNGKIEKSASFKIGTIRLLQNLVAQKTWDDLRKWLKEDSSIRSDAVAVGSGGNINKLFNLAGIKKGKPLSRSCIKESQTLLESMPLAERISDLGLRPDRADVIVPASHIYLNVMEWAGIKKIHVPMLGLADGMIHLLYKNYKAS